MSGRQTVVETIPGTLVKFEMVALPGGTQVMPDPLKPGTTRSVAIKPFWIGRTEVTWDEYDIFHYRLDRPDPARLAATDAVSRPSKPHRAPDRGFGHQGYPAISISSYAAEQYCRWLSARTGQKYRLPTEAEWEYACRAGAPAGTAPDAAILDKHAWFSENAEAKTHPVGTREPNAWGIKDMLGNAAEWCLDPDSAAAPVVRGGSYKDKAEKIHCAAREPETPEWNATDPQNPKGTWWLSDGPFAGLRVVREVE